MKFAHLADTHLGYRQFGLIEREKDFYEVFEKVIDKIIEDRKEEIMDNMSVTNTAYLKSIKSKNSNTLEDVVMKFDSDKYIKRLKKWKATKN